MSFVRINNHIISLDSINYFINNNDEKTQIEIGFATGDKIIQNYATEEEARFVTELMWNNIRKKDTASIDFNPDIIEQEFKTFAQIKQEQKELRELEKMIEAEKLEELEKKGMDNKEL